MAAWYIEFAFVLQASWERKEVETKWSYDRVEIAVCVVGRARDYVHRSLAKVVFAVCGNRR